MSEEPNTTGDKRDEKGRFIKGIAPNPNGRPRGSGISITTRIKQELEKCPEGEDKKTYLELLVRRILKKAIVDGDQIMIKSIWNYIDGLPKQQIELSGGEESITIELKTKANKIIKDYLNEYPTAPTAPTDSTRNGQGNDKSFVPV